LVTVRLITQRRFWDAGSCRCATSPLQHRPMRSSRHAAHREK
jgi:hypothetical protein